MFIAQKAISEKRISLGYKVLSNDYDFVVKTYENNLELKKAYILANEADYVLFGSSDVAYLKERLRVNKLTFKYSERLFKKDLYGLDYIKAFRRVYINHGRYRRKRLYMLCCGMYAPYDFNRFGAYKNKVFKWGYFPETKKYNIEELMKNKQRNHKVSILWAGRLIHWKHPDIFVDVCIKLKNEGIDFDAKIIGNGEMEKELREKIEKNTLNDCVHMLGSMSPENVRKEMEKSNIFLFTSDKQEGWGAVLNEAMNSGCACVASHIAGSTGYLINNLENGVIYQNGNFDDLYIKTKNLIIDTEFRNKLGINAYRTISELWNAEIAAERFYSLCRILEKGGKTPYIQGPCSEAQLINEKNKYWE